MHVYSRYIHVLTLSAGAEECTEQKNTHSLVLQPTTTAHTYQFQRAFRIRLADGLSCSKAVSTSIRALPSSECTTRPIFINSNGPKGHRGLLTRAARKGC